MEKKKKRELLKRTAAVIVSLAMSLVMLGSMEMEVRAAETKEVTINNVGNSDTLGVWHGLGKVSVGTTISFEAYGNDGTNPVDCFLYFFYLCDGLGIDLSGRYEELRAFIHNTDLQDRLASSGLVYNDSSDKSSNQTLSVGTANGCFNLWDVKVAVMRTDTGGGGKTFVVILTPATEDATPTSTGGGKITPTPSSGR